MPNIRIPEGPGEDLQRIGLLQPEMYKGVGALGQAVYRDSKLPIREKEAARMRIAHINGCIVCSDTRMLDMDAYGLDEAFYANVDDPEKRDQYTERERMAIEFAERFAWGKHTLDDAFWGRMHAAFRDEEILDLAICCVCWLGAGRLNAILDVGTECPVRLVEGAVVMGAAQQRELVGAS